MPFDVDRWMDRDSAVNFKDTNLDTTQMQASPTCTRVEAV